MSNDKTTTQDTTKKYKPGEGQGIGTPVEPKTSTPPPDPLGLGTPVEPK